MKTTQIDLYATLERIRKERFPDLDAGLVRDVAAFQAEYMDNQAEAYKRIQQRVENSLTSTGRDADA